MPRSELPYDMILQTGNVDQKETREIKQELLDRYGYGNGDFCTLNCQNDWWKEHGTRAVDNAGRLFQPRVMTPENSWDKRQRYSWQMENGEAEYYYYNMATTEQRPLTESQYNDSTYTLNTGE